VSNWNVFYRNITRGSYGAQAPAAPRKETALIHARALMRQAMRCTELKARTAKL
jgi:hypothetical protein